MRKRTSLFRVFVGGTKSPLPLKGHMRASNLRARGPLNDGIRMNIYIRPTTISVQPRHLFVQALAKKDTSTDKQPNPAETIPRGVFAQNSVLQARLFFDVF